MNKEQVKSMKEFIKSVVRCHVWDRELDGFDMQESAEKLGILIPTEVTEPCGEFCGCNEYFGEDDFPVTCYRFADFLDTEDKDND